MAYAVLASLFHITYDMLNPNPHPIPSDRETIQSLQKSVAFLLSFLETSPPHTYQTVKSLEVRVRDVACKAEDVLESYIVKHFRSISGIEEIDHHVKMLSRALEEVMKEFDSIKEDVKKFHQVDQMTSSPSSTTTAGSSSNSTGKLNFVSLDNDMMMRIKEQLAGEQSGLKVIPIAGMGGIGKTSLARTLFDDKLSKELFDIRAWVTVSQEYRIRNVVLSLLNAIRVDVLSQPKKGESDIVHLHKILYGRKYLIVLDDVWDNKAWDELIRLFPDNNNGSRIMVTTRQSEVATYAKSFDSYHEMKLLSDDMSWELLCQELFAEEKCPPKLVEMGKEIAKKCQGLPLTISVIAGLLSKEKMSRKNWECFADSVKAAITEKDERCLEILSLSYNYLPHRLKSCFLYMGIFPEDYEISVSKLLKLWVAERFLKPGMEETAEENLNDLIERHLILVHTLKANGKPKSCIIHDLVRDLCMREAKKEKFLYVLNRYNPFHPEEAQIQRRLSIHPSVIYDVDCSDDDDTDSDCSSNDSTRNGTEELFELMLSTSLIRSFMCTAEFPHGSKFKFGSALIRVLEFEKKSSRFPEEITELVNLRYIALDHLKRVPSSISKLWNLQTLIASDSCENRLPSEIWNMPQLRHLKVQNCRLPRLRSRNKSTCVLNSLETLSGIVNFRFSDEVLVRVPNLKRLKITYMNFYDEWDWSNYHLKKLVNLSKLESLTFLVDGILTRNLVLNLAFPISLKKLTLRGCKISWEHMNILGELPRLEVLKLQAEAFEGLIWETMEDNFKQLKYLLIEKPVDLREWRVEDSDHFPNLRQLILQECSNLEEIPFVMGEIMTLETIELYECSSGVESSAAEIQENNDSIKLVYHPRKDHLDDGSSSSSDSSSSSSTTV